MKDKWRCYICGNPIGDKFVLFSLSQEADRVFLAHEDCSKQIDGLNKDHCIGVLVTGSEQ